MCICRIIRCKDCSRIRHHKVDICETLASEDRSCNLESGEAYQGRCAPCRKTNLRKSLYKRKDKMGKWANEARGKFEKVADWAMNKKVTAATQLKTRLQLAKQWLRRKAGRSRQRSAKGSATGLESKGSEVGSSTSSLPERRIDSVPQITVTTSPDEAQPRGSTNASISLPIQGAEAEVSLQISSLSPEPMGPDPSASYIDLIDDLRARFPDSARPSAEHRRTGDGRPSSQARPSGELRSPSEARTSGEAGPLDRPRRSWHFRRSSDIQPSGRLRRSVDEGEGRPSMDSAWYSATDSEAARSFIDTSHLTLELNGLIGLAQAMNCLEKAEGP